MELLHYNPDTGQFIRLSAAKSTYVGLPAGGISVGRNGCTYWRLKVAGEIHYAHRLAFLYMTGGWPTEVVDHIDRDGINNRWSNLRQATFTQNRANSKTPKTNKTGYKGVSFDQVRGLYKATIRFKRKNIPIGNYTSPEAAHAAYITAAKKYFGDFASAA